MPDGYFDGLDEPILCPKVKLDELKKKLAASGFTVPENYFDGNYLPISSRELSNNIQARINIEEALDKEDRRGFDRA